jgi:hypothetical protein
MENMFLIIFVQNQRMVFVPAVGSKNVNNQAATKTLLIANLGAHIHKTTTFENEMDALLSLLNEYQKSIAIVVFRTNFPGHYGRQHATGPVSSYEEFAKTLRVSPRSWHLFGSYNDISKISMF